MVSSVVHAEFCWICGLFPQYARARSWKSFQPRARVYPCARLFSSVVHAEFCRGVKGPAPGGENSPLYPRGCCMDGLMVCWRPPAAAAPSL